MRKFDSSNEGLSAMAELVDSASKKVAALLTFQHTNKKQCGDCFLFESVENVESQMIKLYPNDLKITGVEKADMERAVQARNVVASVVALGTDLDFLGVDEPGHAEEKLIKDFDDALGQVDDVSTVVIYVSHSPCQLQDRNASNTLVGWPVGCYEKLCELARRKPGLFFSVVYWKKFGVLERVPNAERVLNASPTKPKNISFVELLR